MEGMLGSAGSGLKQRASLGDAASAAMAVVEYDMSGYIISGNDLFLAMMDCTSPQIAGREHGLQLIAPNSPPGDDLSPATSLWTRLLSQRPATSAVYVRYTPNGRAFYVRASHVVARDDDGTPCGITEFSTDVTQDYLSHVDFRSQIVAVEGSQAVIRFDVKGLILDANDVFLRAMGYSLDQVRGRHHRMFVEPAFAHGPEYAAFWASLARGEHQSGQFLLLGRQGREVWLQATYSLVLGADKSPAAVVMYAAIITTEKVRQAEQQGQIAAIYRSFCVASFDLDGVVLDANDAFLDVMGYRLSDVQGRHHRMFVDDATATSADYCLFWSRLAAGRYHSAECRRIDRFGREVWFQASYNPIFDHKGRPFRVVKYATVVTDDKLRRADDQGQIAAIRRSTAVISFTLDGTVLDANTNFLEPFGYDRDEVIGRHHRIFVEPDAAESDEYHDFWQKLRLGSFMSGLYKRLGKGGQTVWLQASYNPIFDPSGQPYKIVKYAIDVTANVALAGAYEEAQRQSQIDPLTGLANRLRLITFISEFLKNSERRLALLYLDLDHFKPVNDNHGHDVGDHVLAHVADRIERSLSHEQLVARLGGDEFVIVVPDMNDEEIALFGDRLIQCVSEPIVHHGVQIRVGVSIGVATSHEARDPAELLRRADIALYRSKNNQRGCLSFSRIS